jgi:hypothetical protein
MFLKTYEKLFLKTNAFMCCSSTQRRRAFAGRHVFDLASTSGLRVHKRTYLTILESADHALFKMVLLLPLRPELDAKTKACLPSKTRFCHLDEQANCSLHKSTRRKSMRRKFLYIFEALSRGFGLKDF